MVSDIALFFEPVASDIVELNAEGTLGSRIQTFSDGVGFPEIEKGSVVLFGVSEDRRSDCKGSSEGLLAIRQEVYQLKDHFGTGHPSLCLGCEIGRYGKLEARTT